MKFEDFKLGMVCETGSITSTYDDQYEIIGINPSQRSVDIKCVACNKKQYIGNIWRNWTSYGTWYPVSTPATSHMHLAPISAINVAEELESISKYLDDAADEVDDMVAQMYKVA